jgi:hypothetical protein
MRPFEQEIPFKLRAGREDRKKERPDGRMRLNGILQRLKTDLATFEVCCQGNQS